ncbi:MAG: hypothetical protein WCQ32_00360 [bacterium]
MVQTIRIIRLRPECSLLKNIFSFNFALYNQEQRFNNIILLAYDRLTKYSVNYAVKREAFFKKLLKLDFISKEERDKILVLKNSTSEHDYDFVEVEECEEIPRQV